MNFNNCCLASYAFLGKASAATAAAEISEDMRYCGRVTLISGKDALNNSTYVG